MEDKDLDELTEKQRLFCEYYIENWNASDAARRAGYSENTAGAIGGENLKKPIIKDYIKNIQLDLEKVAGLSKLKVLNEHKKIAFSSMSELHKTWIERIEWEKISIDHKACVKKIEYKTMDKAVYNPDTGETESYTVEYVKVELYDKLKSLDSISKMLGYDAPQKVDLTTNGEAIQFYLPKNGTEAESAEDGN
jgi:phage terminase small subunit